MSLHLFWSELINSSSDPPKPASTALTPKKPTKLELPPVPDCCAQPSYQWLCASKKCASCGTVTMLTMQYCLPPSPPPLPGHACCSGCAQLRICQSHCGCGCGCGCGQTKPCQRRCGGGCAQSKPCRSSCGCGQYHKT